MWVFCCGMNRSGSTLQYQLASALVERTGLGKGVGFIRPTEFTVLYERLRNTEGIVVVKCHEFFPLASQLVESGEAKAVGIYRDIRDVAVSYMKFRKMSFWSMIAKQFLEEAIYNEECWLRLKSPLISRYEDVRSDVMGEIERIAGYLGVDADQYLMHRIASEHSLHRNRQRLAEDINEHCDSRQGSLVYDAATLMHPNHITHGGTGQWRTNLSDFRVAVIERICEQWMSRRGYEFSQPKHRRLLAGFSTWPQRRFGYCLVIGMRRINSVLRQNARPEESQAVKSARRSARELRNVA